MLFPVILIAVGITNIMLLNYLLLYSLYYCILLKVLLRKLYITMKALLYIVFGYILKLQASAATTNICNKIENIETCIYNDSVNLQAYHCVVKSGDDINCKQLGFEAVGKENQSITAMCYQKLEQFEVKEISKLVIIPCTSTAKVKVLEDKIEFTPTETCPYNVGYCNLNSSKWPSLWDLAFWTVQDNCNNLEIILRDNVQTWTAEDNVKKYITTNIFNDSLGVIAMELIKETKLCNISVWRTNIDGVLASAKCLEIAINNGNRLYQYKDQFQTLYDTIQSYCPADEEKEKKNVENSTSGLATYMPLISNPQDEEYKISKMENQLICLTVVIVICVLCIIITSIFNIYVNFLSLRKVGEKQEKRNKLYVLNCFCQSLTNRYLFLNKTPDIEMDKLERPLEESRNVNNQQQLYEYIDIESCGNKKL